MRKMHTDIDSRIKHLHSTAETLLNEGKQKAEVINHLCRQGIEKSYAELIIENVHEDKRKRKEFLKHLFYGVFLTAAGILINILSYQLADQNGSGMFLLLWGIVVAGIITLIRGFILFRK